jgi:superfamily II DNA/RNA helicase
VYKSLTKHGFSVAALHGDLPQPVRTKTLESFRGGTIQLLCASDVAARGLDIPAVSHIFNFDVPIHADDYIHRIGRTGRAGREGHAFMIAGPQDFKAVAAIEKLTGFKLVREEMTDIEVTPDHRSPRGDRDHGRDGRRGSGRGRDRDRSRHRGDAPYHDQVASMAPIDPSQVSEAAPAAAVEPQAAPAQQPRHERQPRRDHQPRAHRDHAPKGERPARAAHEPRQHKAAEPGGDRPPAKADDHRHPKGERAAKSGGEHRRRRDDTSVQDDNGSHMPAFLLRPVPVHLIKRKKESEPV